MCPKVRSGYIPIIYILLITDKDLGLSTLTVYGNRELAEREKKKINLLRILRRDTRGTYTYIYI